jgi:hypothetical protein
MCERVEDGQSVPTTCCRRVVMICKISNFDEILEKITKFSIGKRRFIFKCVNVGNVTYAHVCNMQIVQVINFPHLPMCCTHVCPVPIYPTTFTAFP